MDTLKKSERTELWHKIYSEVKLLPKAVTEEDSVDHVSLSCLLEDLFNDEIMELKKSMKLKDTEKYIQMIRFLKEATFEIRNLRRKNELMGARLDMFDSVMALLHTPIAQRGGGMSPDLCSEIDKFVSENELK